MTPTPDAAPPGAGVVDRAGEVLAAHLDGPCDEPRCHIMGKRNVGPLTSHLAEALAAAGILAGGADAVAALAAAGIELIDADSDDAAPEESAFGRGFDRGWNGCLRAVRAALGADR